MQVQVYNIFGLLQMFHLVVPKQELKLTQNVIQNGSWRRLLVDLLWNLLKKDS